MSNVPTSLKYQFTPLTENEGHKLYNFGVKVRKVTGVYPAIFGAHSKENANLASAYSNNKEMYPVACWVFDKNLPGTPIAFALVTKMKDHYSFDIVSNCVGDYNEVISEISADLHKFVENLIHEFVANLPSD